MSIVIDLEKIVFVKFLQLLVVYDDVLIILILTGNGLLAVQMRTKKELAQENKTGTYDVTGLTPQGGRGNTGLAPLLSRPCIGPQQQATYPTHCIRRGPVK